jgi:uncharacterized protein Yka (UPF0111/DUF47 family)
MHRLKDKAIKVSRQGVNELMNDKTDPDVDVKQLKNAYRLMEQVAFSFNEAARTIEFVSLKHR